MSDRLSPIRVRLVAAALVVLLLGAALLWASGRWATAQAAAAADAAAGQTARSHAGLLASELQKFRLLPLVLIEYPDVATALETQAPHCRRPA